ncbi:purine-nucleoside phosphorylase [Algoriphagus namhaensis]
MDYLNQVKEATATIQTIYSEKLEVGIILGTGLSQIGSEIEVIHEIEYANIPHFPISTVESHQGKLIIGKLSGKTVLAMKGRFHYYEGYSMQQVTFPIRVMSFLGLKKLVVSNACGGLNPDQEVGDIMMITDQIDLFPESPLRGVNPPEFGPRFPDMSEPYAEEFQAIARQIASEKSIRLHEGVYVGVQGPNLETKAEYYYLRGIGADAVGMSTVPEVLVANQMGMKVFGLSAITDLGVKGKIKKITIQEVLDAADIASPKMIEIIRELVKRIA